MASRRFTRLTNGFSKKLANHIAAVSLYVAHFNLRRVHEALRITPAMAIGITDHIWTIGELIDDALAEPIEQQVESGHTDPRASTRDRIEKALTDAGIDLIDDDDIGVKLRRKLEEQP
jgi:hypothetical protein